MSYHVQGWQQSAFGSLKLIAEPHKVVKRRSGTTVAMAGSNGASVPDPKLSALRQALTQADGGKGVDAYIIPTEDPHMVHSSPAHHSFRVCQRCHAPESCHPMFFVFLSPTD